MKFKSIIFLILILAVFTNCKKQPIIIAVQPFEGIDQSYVKIVEEAILDHYDCEVVALEAIPLPEECYYKPRNRYRADKLIKFLKGQKPVEAKKIIGVTHRDISTTKGEHYDWGIMGLGYCPGKSCVVSTFRIKRKVDKSLIEKRLRKITIHELGHTFGLKHCKNLKCVMRDACGKVKTIDGADEGFCKKCSGKVNFIK